MLFYRQGASDRLSLFFGKICVSVTANTCLYFLSITKLKISLTSYTDLLFETARKYLYQVVVSRLFQTNLIWYWSEAICFIIWDRLWVFYISCSMCNFEHAFIFVFKDNNVTDHLLLAQFVGEQCVSIFYLVICDTFLP